MSTSCKGWWLALCLAVVGCKPAVNTPYPKETAAFAQYLQRTHGQSIPDSPALYLLLPAVECEQCRADVMPPPATFLNSRKHIITGMIKVKKAYPMAIFDNGNQLGTLKFMGYTPKVLVTRGRGIRIIADYNERVGLDSLLERGE